MTLAAGAAEVIAANHAVLAAAVPSAQVLDYPPLNRHESAVIYQQYLGASDDAVATGGFRRRHHRILIRLLIAAMADDAQAEATAWDLSDAIHNAYAAKRTLGQKVQTSALEPRDGNAYVQFEGDQTQYRQLQWTLDAVETLTIAPS